MPENTGTVDICLMKDKDTARPFNVAVFVTEISSTGSAATGICIYIFLLCLEEVLSILWDSMYKAI